MPAFQEYFDPSHQLVRDSVRRFVEREILPDIDQWEEAESFPASLYLKAGAAGFSASVTPKPWVAATKVICSPRSPPAKS
jgi:alkylation response protein AidB-like acyl-CoA dehydrogenase